MGTNLQSLHCCAPRFFLAKTAAHCRSEKPPMGIINFSIPKGLVHAVTKAARFQNFIETGTFKGGTSHWAATIFPKVYTIEISPELSKTASEIGAGKGLSNVNYLVGDSRTVLPALVPKLEGRSFFWLDGHFCTGAGGEDFQCPLLEELDSLKSLPGCVIFIDDARLFLGRNPPPHHTDEWPRIDEIFAKLHALFPDAFTTVIDDVIVCVPADLRKAVDDFYETTFQERYYNPMYGMKRFSKLKLLKRFLLG